MLPFNQVPIDIKVPGQYLEIDNSRAFSGLSGIPTKVLMIGQMLAAGSAAALTPILITSSDQARDAFGPGSQLAHMMDKAKAANSFVEIHAIGQVDDVPGVAATSTVTFGGAVDKSGTVNIYIAGRKIAIKIISGEATSVIAARFEAAVDADEDLPVTASTLGSVVTLTAKNKGICANDIDVRVNYYSDETLPGSVTVVVVAMAGGDGNPDVTDVIDVIGDEWYTDFVMPYGDTTNIVAMETELDTRFGPLKQMDGHCYVGVHDTHAGLIAKGSGRNSPHVTFIGSKGSPTPSYEWAAILGTVCAFYGKQDPARPFQTLPLPGILPPNIADRFTLEERDLLLRNGISTFTVDGGGVVRVERVITTYRENPFGVSDPSFLDLNTLKTVTYLRYDTKVLIALRYPRFKLADDGTKFARGDSVATPKAIRASLIARFEQWEEQGLVENIEEFKENLIVERDANDPNRVNALIPPNIVNQMRVFAGLVQFRL